LQSAKKLASMGYKIYATPGTSEFFNKFHVPNEMLCKFLDKKSPNVKEYIENGKIDLVINTLDEEFVRRFVDDYLMRRHAVDFNVSLITNLQASKLFFKAICSLKKSNLKIKSWDEYK